MPNGPTHRKITWAVAWSTAPIIFFQPIWMIVEAGILLTMWVNPDMDLHNHAGKLGKLLGAEVYRDLIPHRGGMRVSHWDHNNWSLVLIMSHVPWFGTFPRLLIFMIPFVLLGLVFQMKDPQFWRVFLIFWTLVWFGAGLSDLFHVAADWITARPRRRVRRRRRT